jgi:hypothetical protein
MIKIVKVFSEFEFDTHNNENNQGTLLLIMAFIFRCIYGPDLYRIYKTMGGLNPRVCVDLASMSLNLL